LLVWIPAAAASQLIKRGAMLTVLGGLMTALAWPATLLSATDFIDSKWAIAVDRSDKAGKLLAMILLKGGQGNRPVTLMGYSLGARVIFSCLEELSRKGDPGAIVERVVLLGAPITLDKGRWEMARKVVAGRFVNAFSSNDWILGVVYRATFLTQGLAGLQVVDIPGIENVDVSELVDGHSAYMTKLGEILQGIEIDSFYANHSSKLYKSPSFSGHS
jgi:pimeloyl-ACP methyl ester carboxylesterase